MKKRYVNEKETKGNESRSRNDWKRKGRRLKRDLEFEKSEID